MSQQWSTYFLKVDTKFFTPRIYPQFIKSIQHSTDGSIVSPHKSSPKLEISILTFLIASAAEEKSQLITFGLDVQDGAILEAKFAA